MTLVFLAFPLPYKPHFFGNPMDIEMLWIYFKSNLRGEPSLNNLVEIKCSDRSLLQLYGCGLKFTM